MLPSPVLDKQFPLEVFFNPKPDYSFLKTYDCLCYPHFKPYNSNKFEYRFVPCTFIGYSLYHKGYKCLSGDGRVCVSRRVW